MQLKEAFTSHPYFKDLFERLLGVQTSQQRIRILQETRDSARKEFPKQLQKLENLLLQYNPFTTLATFASCDLTYSPDIGRAINESDPIEQFHIEFIQA